MANTSKLAFPEWVMGQVLLPAQFEAQQQGFLAHFQVMAGLAGLPGHGLVRLVLDEELLATGSLRIEALTYLFPSGLLLDVPGNGVINNANLGEVKADAVSIFLHVANEVGDASELKEYADDPSGLRRVIYRLELSHQAQHKDARESVKLMGLVRRAGRWALDGYVPPLLRLGNAASPFLRLTLDRTQQAIESISGQLSRRIRDAFLGSEQAFELRRVRSAAQQVLALLGDHGIGATEHQQQVSRHPYFIYTSLREFYVDIALLQDDQHELQHLRYRHEDLGGCFEELRRWIELSLGADSLNNNRLEFVRRASWYVAGPFPEQLRAAKDVFLIIKHGKDQTLNLDGFKLASPRRIDEVYTKALVGVPLLPFKSSTFTHVYGHDAVFFRLQGEGSEQWAQAVRDSEICFPAWRELEGISALLVWSVGP